eukprot:5711368-Prymnesium_polylepis.1
MCNERTRPGGAVVAKFNNLPMESVGHVRFDDRFMSRSGAAHGENADFAVFTRFRGYRFFAELWHATELPTGGNLSLRFYVSYRSFAPMHSIQVSTVFQRISVAAL